ncbi:MAG: YciI family protein [Bacteroidota bacterium]
MKDFMLFVRENIAEMTELSEADMHAEIQEYSDWVEGLAKTGNFVAGDPLDAEGRYMIDGAVVSDGPYIEAKEAVTGYLIIKANDLDHAVKIASTCPVFKHGGRLEVRPIMVY